VIFVPPTVAPVPRIRTTKRRRRTKLSSRIRLAGTP